MNKKRALFYVALSYVGIATEPVIVPFEQEEHVSFIQHLIENEKFNLIFPLETGKIEFILHCIQKKFWGTYLIQDEEQLAGFISYDNRKNTEMLIQLFAVSQDKRRKGLGSLLLAHAIKKAEGKAIALHVASENSAARALYKKSGFKVACHRLSWLEYGYAG